MFSFSPSSSIKKILFLVGGLLFVLIVVIVVLGLLRYQYAGEKNNTINTITTFLPYPEAIINYTTWITTRKYEHQKESLVNYFSKTNLEDQNIRVDFETQEGQKRLLVLQKYILEKLIEDALIMHYSNERGIIISKERIDQEVNRSMEYKNTKRPFQENLMEIYNWTLDDFKENVVTPRIYQEELEKAISKEHSSLNIKSKESIDEAYQSLQNGTSFEQAVKQYSQGVTKDEGGELGWFEKELLVKEVSDIIFQQDEGTFSSPIESPLGYHIVFVNEHSEKDDGTPIVNISQIITKKVTFPDWFKNEVKNEKIVLPSRLYYYDHREARVRFTNRDMNTFEEEQQVADELIKMLTQ